MCICLMHEPICQYVDYKLNLIVATLFWDRQTSRYSVYIYIYIFRNPSGRDGWIRRLGDTVGRNN